MDQTFMLNLLVLAHSVMRSVLLSAVLPCRADVLVDASFLVDTRSRVQIHGAEIAMRPAMWSFHAGVTGLNSLLRTKVLLPRRPTTSGILIMSTACGHLDLSTSSFTKFGWDSSALAWTFQSFRSAVTSKVNATVHAKLASSRLEQVGAYHTHVDRSGSTTAQAKMTAAEPKEVLGLRGTSFDEPPTTEGRCCCGTGAGAGVDMGANAIVLVVGEWLTFFGIPPAGGLR